MNFQVLVSSPWLITNYIRTEYFIGTWEFIGRKPKHDSNACFDTLIYWLVSQDVYQRFVDGEDVSKIKKEEDPFWEPPEDVLIGTANVFLQSLSYALDFDDKLSVTDYKVL